VEIWERQPDEPNDWFDRFCRYKLFGATRSLLRAYNEERLRKRQKKSSAAPPGWREAAKTWNWKERAEAWDAAQQQKSEVRHERSNRQWERRRRELRDSEWKLAERLIKQADVMLQRLENPISEEDFKVKWTMRDITQFLETADKLGRLATASDRIPELDALQTLIEAGWVPEEMFGVAEDNLEASRDRIKAAFVLLSEHRAAS